MAWCAIDFPAQAHNRAHINVWKTGAQGFPLLPPCLLKAASEMRLPHCNGYGTAHTVTARH